MNQANQVGRVTPCAPQHTEPGRRARSDAPYQLGGKSHAFGLRSVAPVQHVAARLARKSKNAMGPVQNARVPENHPPKNLDPGIQVSSGKATDEPTREYARNTEFLKHFCNDQAEPSPKSCACGTGIEDAQSLHSYIHTEDPATEAGATGYGENLAQVDTTATRQPSSQMPALRALGAMKSIRGRLKNVFALVRVRDINRWPEPSTQFRN